MRSSDPDSRVAYGEMLRVARKFTFSEVDARDLVQDAVVAAIQGGKQDWWLPHHRAWLFGLLRKRSAFLVRTAQRRRQRERILPTERDEKENWVFQSRFLATLPPSLKVLASLASADLSAREISWLLDLSPTAFRARLSALGRRVRGEETLPVEARGESFVSLGMRRAPILKVLKKLPNRTLATHDPDGHVPFFRKAAHKSGVDGN